MHVLRDYRRRVIIPVYRDVARVTEDISIPELNSHKPLVLHDAMLDERARDHLQTLARRHDVLRAIVEFRDRLQALWDGAQGAERQRVQQLRDLYSFASNSDIAALRDFGARIRRYGPLLHTRSLCEALTMNDVDDSGDIIVAGNYAASKGLLRRSLDGGQGRALIITCARRSIKHDRRP